MRMYLLFRHLLESGDYIHVLCAERLPISHPRLVQHVTRSPLSDKEGLIFWLHFIFISIFQAFYISKKYKTEKIVTFGPFYTLLCVFPIIIHGAYSITFIRSDNMKHSNRLVRNGFFFFADWLGIMLSSRLVFVSNTLRDIYAKRYKFPGHKHVVVPNDIRMLFVQSRSERAQVRTSLGIDDNDFVIATAGVFNAGKNFSFLIQTIKDLAIERIKLLIIGDEVVQNGESQRLKRIANDLGIDSRIIFAGWKDDPRPFICSSDLFVFSSRYEGSPNALLEALGCGVPCLGSDIKEIKEILLHNELMFPLEERSVLIDKLLRLSRDPLYYNHVYTLSKERCKHFCFDWGHRMYSVIHSKS